MIHVTRVTKKQNVVIDGVKYKAVEAASGKLQDTCDHCALSRRRTNLCRLGVAKCLGEDRADGRNVYFIVPVRNQPKE